MIPAPRAGAAVLYNPHGLELVERTIQRPVAAPNGAREALAGRAPLGFAGGDVAAPEGADEQVELLMVVAPRAAAVELAGHQLPQLFTVR